MSPIAKTSGWPWHREVGVDDDASTLGQLDAELLGERIRPHARSPHDDAGGNHRAVGQVDEATLSVARDPGDAHACPHLDATSRQRPACPVARLRRHRPEQPRRGLDEDHAVRSHIDVREVLGEHPREQLHHRPGGLDAGRSTAAQHDVEFATADGGGITGCPLESLQHGEAQVESVVEVLEGDGVFVDAVDAE